MTLATFVWRALQAVLWVVLLGFLVLIGMSRVTPYEVLIVRSGSMQPVIDTGGIVIVDRNGQRPPVLAIASFREPDGSIVTHRVVGMDGETYITRGDANDADDGVHRPTAAVYGTVVVTLPLLGYAIHLLAQPVAFLVLLVGTGGFLIADALRTITQELGRMRRDRRTRDVE